MAKQFRCDSARFALRPHASIDHGQPTTPQFEPREECVRLGRWESDTLIAESCRLRRISQSGALVLLASRLPEGKPVWVSLPGARDRFGSVPARVCKSVVIAPGTVLTWLSFGMPCPAELLYAAVFGTDALEASLN